MIGMDRIVDVTERLSATEQSIALIGMPGCGKTQVGEALAAMLGREHVDIDRELEREIGMSLSLIHIFHHALGPQRLDHADGGVEKDHAQEREVLPRARSDDRCV